MIDKWINECSTEIPHILPNQGISNNVMFLIDQAKSRLQDQHTGQRIHASMSNCFIKTIYSKGSFGTYREDGEKQNT
uniref:Uncharacterized protein n=1 Tax=Peromyscus maniculatus bairdii TaxID=230844 RepID=A0A8C8UHQ9_PERMB